MKLTEDNYYSLKANQEFWSVSQFKTFKECEAKGLAEVQGYYRRPDTEALLLGSYMDAYFTGDLSEFEDMHPEIFNKRTGELKAPFLRAEQAAMRVDEDDMFVTAMEGDHQTIVTGKLFGTKWKAKVDVLRDDCIVDLKYMKDMKPIYVNGDKVPFIDAWGYDIQGYIYQQLVAQKVGEQLPFYLAVITKEEIPDFDIIEIPQWRLNSAGEMVKHYIQDFDRIKHGEKAPERCGKCDWCRTTKRLTRVRNYEELLDE